MKTSNLKIIGFTVLAIVAIVLVSLFFNDLKSKHEAQLKVQEDRVNALALKLFQRDSLINDYLTSFNQIEANLLAIKQQENLLNSSSADPELTGDKRATILEDIKLVNSLLEENKRRIEDLNKKLKNSGLEIKSLNEKIVLLSAAIEERDKSIEELKGVLVEKDFAIAQLNEKVAEIETVVEQKNRIIESKQEELNKAYVITGTYKELAEKGVLVKKGGVLGIRKYVDLKQDISQDQLEQIDITQTKTIPVNARKAELITEHPTGSYEWIQENEMIAYISISNPDEFWKYSKFAVLETK